MQKKFNDPLTAFRQDLRKHIESKYKTVEEFCWENGLNKATVSNVLSGKKDTQISTLAKIAAAAGASLIVRFGK